MSLESMDCRPLPQQARGGRHKQPPGTCDVNVLFSMLCIHADKAIYDIRWHVLLCMADTRLYDGGWPVFLPPRAAVSLELIACSVLTPCLMFACC